MGWRLHWQGEDYRDSEITLSQAERIEALIGETWLRLNVLRSAKHALSTLAVMASDRTGRPFDEVRREVGDIPADVYAAEVLHFEDTNDLPTEYLDGNPQPAAAPSTDTSRPSANRRGAGRQK